MPPAVGRISWPAMMCREGHKHHIILWYARQKCLSWIVRKHQPNHKQRRFLQNKMLVVFKNVKIIQNKENLRNYVHVKGDWIQHEPILDLHAQIQLNFAIKNLAIKEHWWDKKKIWIKYLDNSTFSKKISRLC